VLALGGAAGLWGGAHLSAPRASPGAENVVDVYWMSGVIENGRACVGMSGLHGSNAYDLVADDSGPCYGPESTEVRLRALGYSLVPHVTLAAHMLSGEYGFPSYCDYIEAQTVQQPSGGLRGTYRYIHAQGGSDYWIDIVAGPSSLPRTDVPIGTTSEDSNCQCQGLPCWDGYHTHQDAGQGVTPTPPPT